ncbi:MAG: ABC-F family ATP-binding cassette domain-containing protein [Eubacterium sp.]|nr:ABC-F family ATP-binding cassette domain-containing protein [Eubacterium sp.]
MLYQIRQGTVSLGGKVILDHVDFEIKGKEKIALVGPNGAGKTTLLRLIAGDLSLDRDDRRFEPGIWTARNTTIGMLSQSVFTKELQQMTVEDLIGFLAPGGLAWDGQTPDIVSREKQEYSVNYARIFTGLGFKQEDRQRVIHTFSGGEQTRIALIGLLLQCPDILLLDEPTNHLDLAAIQWLEDYLSGYPGAVVIVSHDRYFLDRTAQVVWELSEGKLTRYAGNYSSYRQEKRQRRQNLLKQYKAQQEEIARLTALIEKYKHKPRKASMARSKKKALERMERIKKPPRENSHMFLEPIQPRELGSKRVLEADKLAVGYDHILKLISLSIRRGQKIGIIGENGTGKTTFLRTITGQIPVLSGKYQMGLGVHPGYFDQQTGQIQSDQRVFEHFCEKFPELGIRDGKKILASYLFREDDTGKRISDLSGGEKSRLFLAELLTEGPNLLLLDEPTNHMDIPARETLESAFAAYTGTILFISHDRYFVQQLADSLLIFGKDEVLYYPFGYDHYLDHLRKKEEGRGAGADAVSAENTRLIGDLRAVPERKRMQSSRFSTDQSYADWQLGLAAEQLKKRAAAVEKLQINEVCWLDDSSRAQWEQEMEEALKAYEESCLDWYEKYMEYEKAFAAYRE